MTEAAGLDWPLVILCGLILAAGVIIFAIWEEYRQRDRDRELRQLADHAAAVMLPRIAQAIVAQPLYLPGVLAVDGELQALMPGAPAEGHCLTEQDLDVAVTITITPKGLRP